MNLFFVYDSGLRFVLLRVVIFLAVVSFNSSFSQDDGNEIELTQEQWTVIRDDYAVAAIKLLAKLDTLNSKIDSLKSLSSFYEHELENYENEMYELVGTSKDGILEYRKKFEETESRINSRSGAPADARKMYFDEITIGKVRCLPEFSTRYISMKEKLENWEGIRETKVAEYQISLEKYPLEGTYTVKKGDNLQMISEIEYGTPGFWYLIWEANKNGVVNREYFYNEKHRLLTNPDLIYPEQILRIPSIKDIKNK